MGFEILRTIGNLGYCILDFCQKGQDARHRAVGPKAAKGGVSEWVRYEAREGEGEGAYLCT